MGTLGLQAWVESGGCAVKEDVLTPIVTPIVTPKATPKATPKVISLVRTINTSMMSRNEIMASLGLKDVMNFFANYLNPAINNDYVMSLYQNSPKHPGQKYYLTDKGMAILKEV